MELIKNRVLLENHFYEINKILGSDYLNIIFDGRNKDYGAYALRKTYNERLAKALTGLWLKLHPDSTTFDHIL